MAPPCMLSRTARQAVSIVSFLTYLPQYINCKSEINLNGKIDSGPFWGVQLEKLLAQSEESLLPVSEEVFRKFMATASIAEQVGEQHVSVTEDDWLTLKTSEKSAEIGVFRVTAAKLAEILKHQKGGLNRLTYLCRADVRANLRPFIRVYLSKEFITSLISCWKSIDASKDQPRP